MHYITTAIQLDLQKKMVFIGCPRQVGKTTLLKRLHYHYGGHRCELRYIRDKEGRKVGFAVIKDGVLENTPWASEEGKAECVRNAGSVLSFHCQILIGNTLAVAQFLLRNVLCLFGSALGRAGGKKKLQISI
jgi:hypothetical protein